MIASLPIIHQEPKRTSNRSGIRVVVYEGEGALTFPPELLAALVPQLLQQGVSLTRVKRGGAITPPSQGTLVVLGRFTQAVPAESLETAAGVKVHLLPVQDQPSSDLLETILAHRDGTQARKPGEWKPWFPVIDYDRCTNCMQCLSFCLFDVYGVSEQGKIQVQNNDKCKTDCPACSRVCPEVAILFPKYRHGPINGDVVSEEDLRRESMKIDISALLGGDIYSALRDRSAKFKSRFDKERDSEKALAERQKCLTKLGEKFDIPAEVFASLPSPEEIQAKATAAAAKAQAALQSQSHHNLSGN